MKASYIKKSLLKRVNFMQEHVADFVRNPGKDFTRKRKCPFESLILLLLTMESHSLKRELRRFFPKTGANVMTRSALVQQRAKLNEVAFPFLFYQLNDDLPFRRLHKGYHLLACDGSDVNIPPLEDDTKTKVPSNTKGVTFQQMHLNAVYDILEERYVDISVQGKAVSNERKAFLEFVNRNPLQGKSIYIADRGYFSLNVLAHLIESSTSFLLRMNAANIHSSFIKRFKLPDQNEFDIDLDFYVCRSRKKEHLKNPAKYVYVKNNKEFDFIPKGDRTTIYPISARLVKLMLPTGEAEYLLTDLPRNKFDIAELRILYNLRWGIETSFRFLKYNMALSCFHSVRRDFILQEIYARIILYNLTMQLAHTVTPSCDSRKYTCKVSVSDAVVTCRDFLLYRIKNEEIEARLLKYLTEIRPGRLFPRKTRSKRFVPLINRV